jgi:two-component system sporulation sensor kinase B
MIYVLVLAWTIAFIVKLINPKRKPNIWYSRFVFFLGIGAVAAVIQENIVPIYKDQTSLVNILSLISRFLSVISYRLCPYCYLIFGLEFSKIINSKIIKKILILAFVAVLFGFLLDFINPKNSFLYIYLDYSPQFKYDCFITIAIVLFVDFLLIYSYIKEYLLSIRQQKLLICVLTIPFSIYIIYTNFISALFGMYGVWRYNLYIAIIIVIFVAFCSITYGILGLKIKFERYYYDSRQKILATGISMLNHTFKNELKKMEINLKELKNESEERLQPIYNSIYHMTDMVKRIHEKTEEIRIIKENINLKSLIEFVLSTFYSEFQLKNIKLYLKFDIEPVISCDKTHIREVISNIIKNSIEAMDKDSKELFISVYSLKNNIIIDIKDNGKGLSKENMTHIFEPFFTTKKDKSNLGLGLSYCYNVIFKHGGQLEFQSQENEGTTVLIKLPVEKHLRNTLMLESNLKG